MSINMDEAWFWFTNIQYIGRKTRNKLLELFESPVNIFNASDNVIENISFISKRQKDSMLLRNIDCIRKELYKIRKKNIAFIYKGSNDYPITLNDIPDSPHSIYISGNYINWNSPSVAIVGSRNCTAYGYNMAYKTAYELALSGVTIVSGMAKGIDGAAQKGCIAAGGSTCAVLGCGVDICYPESNIELYTNIKSNGCIISEYLPGTPPLHGFFPERNRIISALGNLLLVVEAGEKSGSLITVDCALEQGKDVFVMPGRVTDILSRGCNNMIKNGAAVFESTSEILQLLGIKNGNKRDKYKNSIYKKSNISLATDEKIVYAELGLEPKHINSLARETNMPVETVMRILVGLELRHIVSQTAGNYFAVDLYN